VRLLLDTHLLLWAAFSWRRLPVDARLLLEDKDNILVFSVANLWEVAIKRSLGREDFRVDPRLLRRGLLDNDYEELPILGPHSVAVDGLPLIHKDPFDRILIAQSLVEGITLLTIDPLVAQYPAPVRGF
jgi:PIN domain nuclease of toxin-antitoxin system